MTAGKECAEYALQTLKYMQPAKYGDDHTDTFLRYMKAMDSCPGIKRLNEVYRDGLGDDYDKALSNRYNLDIELKVSKVIRSNEIETERVLKELVFSTYTWKDKLRHFVYGF